MGPGPAAAPGPGAAAAAWAETIDQAAVAALAAFTPGRPVRLLGVRAEFADNPA